MPSSAATPPPPAGASAPPSPQVGGVAPLPTIPSDGTPARGAPEAGSSRASESTGAPRISPRTEFAPGDRKFITAAASSLALEEGAARLALERSSNHAVRSYASDVVVRNKSAGAELASLAAKKDASDAIGMSPQHVEILTSLANAKGVAFDRAFAVQLGLQAPEDLVITFNRIARESSDGDMRAYAERLLPALRAHQREAVQMARAAGAPRHRVEAAQDLLPPDPAKDAAKGAASDATGSATKTDESR